MAASGVSMAPANAAKGTGWGDDSSLPLFASRETALGCSFGLARGFRARRGLVEHAARHSRSAAEELLAADDFLEALRELGRAAKVIQGQAVIEHGRRPLPMGGCATHECARRSLLRFSSTSC